jgi:hypothetical protein
LTAILANAEFLTRCRAVLNHETVNRMFFSYLQARDDLTGRPFPANYRDAVNDGKAAMRAR